MVKAVAINGSPRKGKGNTAMLLGPFLEGLQEAGAACELFYASKLRVQPCSCGSMMCWYRRPGQCCYKDDMRLLYPRLQEAELLILATPVYIPLPGELQNILNRLCPLAEPYLEFRQGRTRVRLRPGVNLRQIVLVATGGWWELANFDTVVRIVCELAADLGVEFGGALLRPHAFVMRPDGELTPEGAGVLAEVKRAGVELIRQGAMDPATLEAISQPLITEAELREYYNQALEQLEIE